MYGIDPENHMKPQSKGEDREELGAKPPKNLKLLETYTKLYSDVMFTNIEAVNYVKYSTTE